MEAVNSRDGRHGVCDGEDCEDETYLALTREGYLCPDCLNGDRLEEVLDLAYRDADAPNETESSEGQVQCPTCGEEFSCRGVKLHHPQAHGDRYDTVRLEEKFGVPIESLLETQHHVLKRSKQQMAEELDVGVDWIREVMDDYDIEQRSISDITQQKWDTATDEKREKMLSAAHERTRELTESGENPLLNWAEQNPDALSEIGPEENLWHNQDGARHPLEGLRAQDNPNWRGGRSIYDAVRRLLADVAWDEIRERILERDSHRCRLCGKPSEQAHNGLDVHHIVPIMAGGTHGEWNLLAVCNSCHSKTERYTEDLFPDLLSSEYYDGE